MGKGREFDQFSFPLSEEVWSCVINDNNNNNNTLYYSAKSSSKATQSSLIGVTVHNTGISLVLSISVWVLLSPPDRTLRD